MIILSTPSLLAFLWKMLARGYAGEKLNYQYKED